MHVGEDFELVAATHVVAVTGGTVGNYPALFRFTHLAGLKGLDHLVLLRHAANPLVGFNAHTGFSYPAVIKTTVIKGDSLTVGQF
jgi:hypothetical protein